MKMIVSISKMLKKNLFSLIRQKLLIFPSLSSLNQLLNLGLFNIHKMRQSNRYVVFSPKESYNFTKH